MLYTTTGFVIKKRPLNEKDVILTILSVDRGRFDVVAKSLKSPKSRKAGKLDLMNIVRGTFAEGKNLDILTECKLENSFRDLKKDMTKNIYIWILLELVEKITNINPDDTREIFHNLKEVTKYLSEEIDNEKLKLLLAALGIFLMRDSGFSVNFENFIDTGNEITKDSKIYFNHELGFSESKDKVIQIDTNLFKTIRFLSISEDVSEYSRIQTSSINLNILLKIVCLWYEEC
ncbi:MAG: DNA repair protein RecO, partial [bacterium]